VAGPGSSGWLAGEAVRQGKWAGRGGAKRLDVGAGRFSKAHPSGWLAGADNPAIGTGPAEKRTSRRAKAQSLAGRQGDSMAEKGEGKTKR